MSTKGKKIKKSKFVWTNRMGVCENNYDKRVSRFTCLRYISLEKSISSLKGVLT